MSFAGELKTIKPKTKKEQCLLFVQEHGIEIANGICAGIKNACQLAAEKGRRVASVELDCDFWRKENETMDHFWDS